MFKGQPKGLFVLAFSNMGERFGYYTMLAIFTLFLQDYFGWGEDKAANLYGYFLAGIYILPMIGGIVADKLLGYGKTVMLGIVIMGVGYVLLSQTTTHLLPMYFALAVIALGVGLFKGNLAVIVGNLYEKAEIGHLRDAAFNIFYMFINIGAFFAPHLASWLKDKMLISSGFVYDAAIPRIAHDIISGNAGATNARLAEWAQIKGISLAEVSQQYIDALSSGYKLGFLAAAVSMVISLAIFLIFKKHYAYADYTANKPKGNAVVVELTGKQTRDRIVALLLVFVIVIFFWMAFHQNGSTLTFFAKNYTAQSVGKLTYLLFTIPSLLSIFVVILGGFGLLNKQGTVKFKITSGAFALAGLGYIAYLLSQLSDHNPIAPELFQAFNPMFVVFMTPVIIGIFSYLNKRKREPSAPAKIGFGMTITAIGFGILLYASWGLPSIFTLGGNAIDAGSAVSPYFLISTYFTLTIAELCLSPMGLSFVSKVAPPKWRGTMQAGWLGATAIGNYFAGFIGRFYKSWELWQFFLFLVIISLVSAAIMFAIMRIVNKASNS